jgi:predicted DNA-binding protein
MKAAISSVVSRPSLLASRPSIICHPQCSDRLCVHECFTSSIEVKYCFASCHLVKAARPGYRRGMKRDTSVNVRLTSEMREELQKLADAHKRTLSDYIRLLLEEHLEQQKTQAEAAAKRKRPPA